MRKRFTLFSVLLTTLIFCGCMSTASTYTGSTGEESTQITDTDAADEKTALILDTDAGTDDASAILIMKNLGINPDYIVATGGNASADGAVRNSVILKKYLNLSSEIVRGDENLQSEEQSTFHGPDGFAGISEQMIQDYGVTEEDLEDYTSLEDFTEELKDYDRIDYISIGPLTTLSYLCEDEAVNEKLSDIYLMGGGLNEFNNSHETEFNFSKNPEADVTVLSSGHNIMLFTLDLTKQQRLDEDQIDQIESIGNLPEYITLIRYNRKANVEHNDIDAAILHDTMPILYYADSEDFQTEGIRISCDEYGHIELADDGYPVTYAKSVESGLMYEALQDAFTNVEAAEAE